MKDFVLKMKSYVTFDFPTRMSFISQVFEVSHLQFIQENPRWSINATSKKLIAQYWFSYVFGHFSLLIVLSFVPVMLIEGWSLQLGLVFPAFYVAVFPVLLVFHYWPTFYSQFIPALETVKESFLKIEVEKLEKCRQMQLSNLALALIYYVVDKSSNINTLQNTDRFSQTLTTLFGVDPGSLKKNITLIIGAPATVRSLSSRKRTEIRNKFTEAYTFLETLPFPLGVQLLKELEMKFKL